MKKKISFVIFTLLAFLATGSCSKKQKTEAEIEREQWIAGFSDSINYYQDQTAQIDSRLETLNGIIGNLLENFEYVRNPREVTGYYIQKGWNSKIPFTTTGIYARVNDNEKLELIATLAGNTFNKIGVGDFSSETVPHDQAFNYRHQRFNTVYFSGGKADTIAQYIAEHAKEKINLHFMEGNKKVDFAIPQNEKDMIQQTWQLYSAKSEALKLQKELWMNSRKIETFRRIMDANNAKPEP